MKLHNYVLITSLVLAVSACSKSDDSSSSSTTSSTTSSSTSSYTRSSTPSSLSITVPAGISASTISTSSRSSAGRTANAYASSGPCQDVSQTGESSIPNNKVAVGCESLAKATELLGGSIMLGDFYLNMLDSLIAAGTATTSSTCQTASIAFTSAMYESMTTIATKVGIDSSAYSSWTSKAGTNISLAYVYNTATDSDYTYQLQVASACDNINNSSGVST